MIFLEAFVEFKPLVRSDYIGPGHLRTLLGDVLWASPMSQPGSPPWPQCPNHEAMMCGGGVAVYVAAATCGCRASTLLLLPCLSVTYTPTAS